MLHFTKIRWKNLLSTGNAFTEIDLDSHKTTLIIGENGAGKSTILDALFFVLYNRPFRAINKPQLLNSINKKDLVVEVEFISGETQYLIRRGIKPNIFDIYEDGVLIDQDASSRDYQDFLEKRILKLNHHACAQVVVLGSASFTPFMELPAGRRRDVIEDLLDIQIFSIMNNLLKDRVQGCKEESSDFDHKSQLVTEKISMQQSFLQAMREDVDERTKETKDRLIGLGDALQLAASVAAACKHKILDLENSILDKGKVLKLHNKLTGYYGAMQSRLEAVKNSLVYLDNASECEKCFQKISHDHVEDVRSRNTGILTELDSGLVEARLKLAEVETRIKEIESAEKTLSDERIKLHVSVNSIQSLKKEIINLTDQLARDEKRLSDSGSADEIGRLQESLLEIESKRKDLAVDREALACVGNLLKDTGIKSMIIKQYVPMINRLINKYLAELDFFVDFHLDENFTETIKSRHRDVFSYASFSEGEKFRINIALLFAWRAIAKIRNSASTNLLIMDEIFDSSLDTAGTEDFSKMLHHLTGTSNALVISHRTDQVLDKFDRVLTFEKHKNFSVMSA